MQNRIEINARRAESLRESLWTGSRLPRHCSSLTAVIAWAALLSLAPLYANSADATPPANAQLTYFGGNVVIHPTYVNVFWGAFWTSGTGLAQRQTLNSFQQTVGSSLEFVSVLQQYTGPGGVVPQVGAFAGERLISREPGDSSNSITDDQIRTAIDGWIAAGLVSPPTPDLIYNIYFPTGVTVRNGTDSSGTTFCSYHSSTKTTRGTGGALRYIVMPYPDVSGCHFESTITDDLTVEMSHQMAETITDPDVGIAGDTNLATYLGWYDNNNGEIGDICAMEPDATLLGYRVQTLWSNVDGMCIASRSPSDATPPVITPTITGTLGSDGWYTSDIGITWTVSDPESPISLTTGCDPVTVNYDTAPIAVTCSAMSAGGTSQQSITIKRDATKPTVTYSGNAGSYSTDQTISISCVASDSLSGIASSTCASISGPAYGFSIGTNTFAAGAMDNAGNSAVASTTFTVTASAGSLLQLTRQFVESSEKYQILTPHQRMFIDRLVDVTERILAAILPRLDPRQKTALIDAYLQEVARLVQGGWLTSIQAATLGKIANAL